MSRFLLTFQRRTRYLHLEIVPSYLVDIRKKRYYQMCATINSITKYFLHTFQTFYVNCTFIGLYMGHILQFSILSETWGM